MQKMDGVCMKIKLQDTNLLVIGNKIKEMVSEKNKL
jgi:hypothetical protein